MTIQRNRRKSKIGIVLKKSGINTYAVKVETRKQHPFYQKTLKATHKYLVDYQKDDLRVGDRVAIAECRPLSKCKRWRVVSIVEHAKILD